MTVLKPNGKWNGKSFEFISELVGKSSGGVFEIENKLYLIEKKKIELADAKFENHFEIKENKPQT